MTKRRQKGATLGLVAVVALVILLLGAAFYFLTVMMGGSREMTSAVDSGALNLAKQALRTPSKDLAAFSNQDIKNNFSLLADNGKANLLSYNRFVAQAIIVALNAKDENTPDSASNAKKVWQAVNDVGEYLRNAHQDPNTMGGHFISMASSNNIKMLGTTSGVNLRDYEVAFMRKNGSTNVYFDPEILKALPEGSGVPLNTTGLKSPSGHSYLSGYAPFSVTLPQGDKLSFVGVPLFPQRTPHLVNYKEFQENLDDSFTGANYPAECLPANAFKVKGSPTSTKATPVASVACAIVGVPNSVADLGKDSPGNGYGMAIPGGYIVIRNGPSAARPAKMPANYENDIFTHELADGIFTQGSKPSDIMCTRWNNNRWNEWVRHNTEGGPEPLDTLQWQSTDNPVFRKGDLSPVTIADLKTLTVKAETLPNTQGAHFCEWEYYDEPPVDPVCVAALENFKKAFARPGSVDSGNVQGNGFTTMEMFKVEALAARYDIKTCANVPAPSFESGVKWFDRQEWYQTPSTHPYNFGEVKTPYDYLAMVDDHSYPSTKKQIQTFVAGEFDSILSEVVTPHPDTGKAFNGVMDNIVQRCKEMSPAITKADVEAVLKTQQLPLGGELYLFLKNGKLSLSQTAPAWAVPGTRADGATKEFGAEYDAHRYVDAFKDGDFDSPYGRNDPISCADKAHWIPGTGFNNLLGELRFTNTCTGGGEFCQPN